MAGGRLVRHVVSRAVVPYWLVFIAVVAALGLSFGLFSTIEIRSILIQSTTKVENLDASSEVLARGNFRVTSTSGPTVTSGAGAPGSSAPAGSLYLRTGSPQGYINTNGATSWTPFFQSGNFPTTSCSSGQAVTQTAATGAQTCATFFQSGNFPTTTCSSGQAVTQTAATGAQTCAVFFNATGDHLSASGSTVSLAQIATASFLGRTSAGPGNVETLTATQATALLDVVSISVKGLVPTAPNDTTKYLRGDATWATLVVSANSLAGSGIDGACNFDGVTTPVCGATLSGSTYTMTGPLDVTNWTEPGGVIVDPNGYPIHINGAWTGAGFISANGASAAGRIAGVGRTAAMLPGSTSGGNGAIGVATASVAGTDSATVPSECAVAAGAATGTPGATGAKCGGGGGGTQATAGKAGGATSKNGSTPSTALDFRVIGWMTGATRAGAVFSGSTGGGGGGASVNSSTTGGGGGAGAGWVLILARACNSAATVTSIGGAGGNAVCSAAPAGGGGGGGGSHVIVECGSGTLPTISVAGGSAGTGCGGGPNGGPGGPGVNYSWVISP